MAKSKKKSKKKRVARKPKADQPLVRMVRSPNDHSRSVVTRDRAFVADESYLMSVKGGVPLLQVSYLSLTPQNYDLAPFIASFASRYERFRITELRFEYTPTVATYTTPGLIVMAFTSDPTEVPPDNLRDLMVKPIKVAGNVSNKLTFVVPKDAMFNSRDDDKYINVGADPRLSSAGRVFIATEGCTLSTPGILSVRFKCELREASNNPDASGYFYPQSGVTLSPSWARWSPFGATAIADLPNGVEAWTDNNNYLYLHFTRAMVGFLDLAEKIVSTSTPTGALTVGFDMMSNRYGAGEIKAYYGAGSFSPTNSTVSSFLRFVVDAIEGTWVRVSTTATNALSSALPAAPSMYAQANFSRGDFNSLISTALMPTALGVLSSVSPWPPESGLLRLL